MACAASTSLVVSPAAFTMSGFFAVRRHVAHGLQHAERRWPGQAESGVEYPQVMPDRGGPERVHDDDRAAPAVQPPGIQRRQVVSPLDLPRPVAGQAVFPQAPGRRGWRGPGQPGGPVRCWRGWPGWGRGGAGARPGRAAGGKDVAVTSRHDCAKQRAQCDGRYRENLVCVARAYPAPGELGAAGGRRRAGRGRGSARADPLRRVHSGRRNTDETLPDRPVRAGRFGSVSLARLAPVVTQDCYRVGRGINHSESLADLCRCTDRRRSGALWCPALGQAKPIPKP